MGSCNPTVTPIKVNAKIEKSIEEVVDMTLFKKIVGYLRYLCNRRPDMCYRV